MWSMECTDPDLEATPQVAIRESAGQGAADAVSGHQHAALPLAGQLRQHIHDVHVWRHLCTA